MKKFLSLFVFALLTMTAWAANASVNEPRSEDAIVNLSQANALEDGGNFTFNGQAVVTVYKNGYMFLRDESGCGQINGIVDGEYENGQVLNEGWTATKTSNDGWAWYTNPEAVSVSGETNASLAAPQKLTGAVDESMLNAYVVIENVTKSSLPVRSLPLPDGTSIAITDCLWASNQPASGQYNVYGIICKVNGNLMFNLVNWEKYVAPPAYLRGDVNGDNKVDIDDVTLLIAVVLGNGETYVAEAADCNVENGDGSIDIDDVTALISYVLSGSWD